MRNRTIVLLIGLAFVGYFLLDWFGPKRYVNQSQFHDLLWMFVIAIGMYCTILLEQYKSPKLFWYGGSSTILQSEPMAVTKIIDPKNPTNEIDMGLFLLGGIREFGAKGGGTKGYMWTRVDLIETQPGNFANLKINGTKPHEYQLGADPATGINDLYCLPENMYNATVRAPNWNEKAVVMVCWFPAKTKPEYDQKTGMPLLSLWEQANKQLARYKAINGELMDDTVNISRTHSSVTKAFSRKAEQKNDTGLLRRREEEDDDYDR
jgi:hypothetical protein